MASRALVWLVLLVTPLVGCAPQLRASWHLVEGEVPSPDGRSAKPSLTLYLTLTNLETTAVTIRDLTVNGRDLDLDPTTFQLSPGEIRVIDLGSFKCALPLSVEFHDGGYWRHRVRSVSWMPSAPPENIEDWCQWRRRW